MLVCQSNRVNTDFANPCPACVTPTRYCTIPTDHSSATVMQECFFFRLDQELPYLNGLTNTGAALKILTEQVINSAYDRCVDFSRFFTIFHVVILIKTSWHWWRCKKLKSPCRRGGLYSLFYWTVNLHNAAATLVLVLELVRVFCFSFGNLSKSFSFNRLHWPTSGFAAIWYHKYVFNKNHSFRFRLKKLF